MAIALKVLACATVATALCCNQPAAAQSTASVYGLLDIGVASRQLSGDKRTVQVLNGAMTTSFLGVRGSEDLDGGLRAIFGLESFLRADTGDFGRSSADPYWARQAFVGIASPYRTLRAGRVVTPTFIASGRYSPLGAAAGVGPFMMQTFVASAGQPMITGSSGSDSAWSNAVSFSMRASNGLSATVIAAAGEGGTAGKRTGGGATWDVGAFSASLNIERLSAMALPWGAPAAPLATAAKPLFTAEEARIGLAGASYDFGVIKLFGMAYVSELTSTTRTEARLRTSQLGASAPFGPGQFVMAWAGTHKTQTSAADITRDTTTAGYVHALSRRTDLYALLTNDKITNLNDGNSAMLAIRHSF